MIYSELVHEFGEDVRSAITELEKEGKLKLKLDGNNVNVYHGPLDNTRTPIWNTFTDRDRFSSVTSDLYSSGGDGSIILRIGELEFPIERLQYNREVNVEPIIGVGSHTPYATTRGHIDYSGSFTFHVPPDDARSIAAQTLWNPYMDGSGVHFEIQTSDTIFRNCVVEGIERDMDIPPRFNVNFRAQTTTTIHQCQVPGHIENITTTMGVGFLNDTTPTETLTLRYDEF